MDKYFEGKKPKIEDLPIEFIGSTFRKKVWMILYKIPYGQIVTYGDIAKLILKQNEIQKMSAQVVGGAISHNPISIIVLCHRVVGSNGSLIGYSGGIKVKMKLLKFEKVDISKLCV